MKQRTTTVDCWDRFELRLGGPESGNPFVDVQLSATFRLGNRRVEVRGFYDGAGSYLLRFMPDEQGEWSYRTRSNLSQLEGREGRVVARRNPGHRGMVRAVGTGFAYDDGTRYIPFGTTAYVWTHQRRDLREQTLATLAAGPFTKIRMCLFPKHYRYNHGEPERFVFPGSLEKGFDFTRFDPAFFRDFEAQIDALARLGIQADLILFHSYDRWGFQSLSPETEEAYLRYVVARLSSFHNVWWSVANEWDFMKAKTILDFHRHFRVLQREDPYGHLRSIHNGEVFYDHALPWVSHASLQTYEPQKATAWREQYGKPVVIDECSYEGDVPEGWGNITGQELVRRLWTGLVHGAWPGGHGETFYNEEEELWWSAGGHLVGEAPPRIAFMRRIVEEAPADFASVPLRWGQARLGAADGYQLHYFGRAVSSFRNIDLPEDGEYRLEIVDTWNMTRTLVPGLHRGPTRVQFPRSEFLALVVRPAAGTPVAAAAEAQGRTG